MQPSATYRADLRLIWASDSLNQLGKGLQSHLLVREMEPKGLSDLLKATQLVGDNWAGDTVGCQASTLFMVPCGNLLVSDQPSR